MTRAPPPRGATRRFWGGSADGGAARGILTTLCRAWWRVDVDRAHTQRRRTDGRAAAGGGEGGGGEAMAAHAQTRAATDVTSI